MSGYGQILRDLRGNKTIFEVAKDVGIQPSSLSMYENELRNPRDDVKIKLANYYNTTVGFIFYTKNSQ